MQKEKIWAPLGATGKVSSYSSGEIKRIQYSYVSSFSFDDDLDRILLELKNLKDFHQEVEKIRFEKSRDCGCYDSCNCDASYRPVGYRLETDEEFEVRKHNAECMKKAQEENEKKQLELLLKKYPDKFR
jgi:hypothetical protein